MFDGRVAKLLGTKYPIIQGGMAWVADANLAAAVSNAGGLGLIGSGAMDRNLLKEQIDICKKLTDKPFGVNIMLMNPHADDLAQLLIEEKVAVVTTGAGSPGKYVEAWKAAGIVVIPVVASTGLAKRMESLGVDAVVAEGCEAGGHIGELTTMVLVPQVADSVSIPVLAAGGIADGRGLAAAKMLGANGAQIGTRFLVARECTIHQNYKDVVLKSRDIDSRVTGRSGGHPVRSVKTPLVAEMLKMEKEGATFEEMEAMTVGSLRKAVKDGNVKEGSFMAGQIAGMINKEQTAAEILQELSDEYEACFQ
ncbi:MAG TPA: enoyl-[acyl-carrier-protein] reductase FabK [Bacillota bacterium]|nr:enoyl-[acyl-carrier-protein] reductase FabK [Bacillota bacterium]